MKEIQLVFKKGRNYQINVTHEIDNFLISYEALGFNDVPLEQTNVKLFLERVKRVSGELAINRGKFFIEFIYDVGGASCCVDDNKIIHLTLPISVKNGQIILSDRGINDDYLLYHELMHAKEVLDGRFPSSGEFSGQDAFLGILIGRLCDFANEGKLEVMGKPHLSKEIAINNVYDCFGEDYEDGNIPPEKLKLLTKGMVTKLCDKVWGKDLTYSKAEKIIGELLGI